MCVSWMNPTSKPCSMQPSTEVALNLCRNPHTHPNKLRMFAGFCFRHRKIIAFKRGKKVGLSNFIFRFKFQETDGLQQKSTTITNLS